MLVGAGNNSSAIVSTTASARRGSPARFRSNQFCRELRLTAEVEANKTTAVLKDGVLELVFTKAAGGKAVDVEVKPE